MFDIINNVKQLKEAYKILTSIPSDASKEVYKQKAKEAFVVCPACVEAVLFLNYFEKDIDLRIENLGKCIEEIEVALIEKDDDKNLIPNLERAKSTLVDEYIEDKEYEEASYLLDTIDENKYDAKFRKMTLLAKLNDERIEDLYDKYADKAIDHGYIYLTFPYMVYLYKNNKLDQIKTYFDKMHDINPDIMAILTGIIKEGDAKSDQTKSALDVLKTNGYLINDTPGFIEFLINLLNKTENYS